MAAPTIKQYTPAPLRPLSILGALSETADVPSWSRRHLPELAVAAGGSATIRARCTAGTLKLRDKINPSRQYTIPAGEDLLVTLATPFEVQTVGGSATWAIDVEAVSQREAGRLNPQ